MNLYEARDRIEELKSFLSGLQSVLKHCPVVELGSHLAEMHTASQELQELEKKVISVKATSVAEGMSLLELEKLLEVLKLRSDILSDTLSRDDLDKKDFSAIWGNLNLVRSIFSKLNAQYLQALLSLKVV